MLAPLLSPPPFCWLPTVVLRLLRCAQYIELVDCTGRQLKPGKRGVIASSEPPALQKLGISGDYWTGHVKGFRSAYQRFVGSVEAIAGKAKALNQQWLKGIGYARSLAANR